MQLISKAFNHLQPIPTRFSGEGEDISPALEWSEIPENCRELALVCEDPDAPVRPGKDHPFVHWLAYNINTDEHGLHENLPKDRILTDPFHVYQGMNSSKKIGYMGPMPPEGHGVHHYIFTLYALDMELRIEPGATKDELLTLINKHTIEIAQLIGTYERSLRRTDDKENAHDQQGIEKAVEQKRREKNYDHQSQNSRKPGEINLQP